MPPPLVQRLAPALAAPPRRRAAPRPRAEPAGAPPPPPDAPEPAGDAPPAADAGLRLPPAVIQRLRERVFSLDTLFVRSTENFSDGRSVLFRGNLRAGADPAAARAKMAARLTEELGDEYRLFLMEGEDGGPVAVVAPEAAVVAAAAGPAGPAAEAALAAALALLTAATTLNTFAGGDLFNVALLAARWDPAAAAAAVPAAAAFAASLAAHEAGHLAAARAVGARLAPPLLVPAGLGLLGSLGAITRIAGPVRDRAALAAIGAAGPLAQATVSAAVAAAGLAATRAGAAAGGLAGAMELDAASFKETLLGGALGYAAFGDGLFTADVELVFVSPLLLAGWAGLIVAALNSIPIGSLDGGRLALALFGRRTAATLSFLTLIALGLGAVSSSLAFAWVAFAATLQRAAPEPCEEELAPLGAGAAAAAVATLLLPLIVFTPLLAVSPFPSAN
jgi:membrane-associated protease RseP (regulator of RpoE activity)